MRDKELYGRILGVAAPWRVADVELNLQQGEIVVHVEHAGPLTCPHCGQAARRYDSRQRRWRHLDTCQYRTILAADVPRSQCRQHGVKQLAVPWSEGRSRLTALCEAVVIDWLQHATTAAVAQQMRLSWDEVDGVMQRAVQRGLRRRAVQLPPRIGVDETSFQKRHEYVTVINDLDGHVVHVADGRRKEVLEQFYQQFDDEQLAGVETVAMDMWEPYISATAAYVPEAEHKIAFDKFHVAKHLGDAVDQVRRAESRRLASSGDDRLKGSRYTWLTNPEHMDAERWQRFAALRDSALQTARAWGYKEHAMTLWNYRTRGWARQAWQAWYQSAIRCRLEPVKRVARMVKRHLEGIVTAVVQGVSNARAESINAGVQWLKYAARGFRNRQRFRNAIYFHLGGLDLYPAGVIRDHLVHTKA